MYVLSFVCTHYIPNPGSILVASSMRIVCTIPMFVARVSLRLKHRVRVVLQESVSKIVNNKTNFRQTRRLKLVARRCLFDQWCL